MVLRVAAKDLQTKAPVVHARPLFEHHETMIINTEYVDLPADRTPMRTLVAAPREGRYPGILLYSDIFQLTGPMVRATARLAGYGFVVAAPEIYHRIEPPGSAIPFDDDGRDRGQRNAAKTAVAEFDADCRVALDYLSRHRLVERGQLGAGGFCIGGHLAFRAALQPDVKATVCFYGTGIHNGKLGMDDDAGSLQRARDITGKLLMVFGSEDPHVPEEARHQIIDALADARPDDATRFSFLTIGGVEHAFMRDEGRRYDPEASDRAWSEMIDFFRKMFCPWLYAPRSQSG